MPLRVSQGHFIMVSLDVEIIPRFYRGKIKASAKKKGRALSKPKSVEKQLNLQVKW